MAGGDGIPNTGEDCPQMSYGYFILWDKKKNSRGNDRSWTPAFP